MSHKNRWLAAALAVAFLGLVVWLALSQDPDFWRSPAALYQAAQAAEHRGDLSQALQLAQKAWSRQPDNSGYGVALGWLHLKAVQPEAAHKVFQQVWQQDPEATGALKGLAQTLDLLGRRPEALDLLHQYLKSHPDEAGVLQFAAELASRRREDRSLAAAYYQRLYRLQPDPEVRRLLLDLLTALGRFDQAIPLQAEEAAQFPDNLEAWQRLALLHYWQRDYQAATEVYSRLLELAAEDAELRQKAAQTAEAAKNVDEALKHYLWLYGRFQGKKEYALALARLWSQKGNHAEAAAVLAPLMQDKPERELQRWYALELLLTRDFTGARKAYTTAWEAGDTHQETILNLARLYAQSHEFGKAAAFWDEARRRQLLKGELRWEAALTYSYARRYQDAVTVLQPVARDHPDYPRLQVFLGQMHFYQQHWGQAAHYFRAYLEKHPQDVEVRRQLAEALALAKDTRDEAIGQYGEVLQRQEDPALRLRRLGLLLEAKRWQEAEAELKTLPLSEDPRLLREQARLFVWAGDLEGALKRYERFASLTPRDREAALEHAQVLIYLGQPPAARKVLQSLRLAQPGLRETPRSYAAPEMRRLVAAYLAAELAAQNWPEAGRWALRLFSGQFQDQPRLARDWPEAWQWFRGEIREPEGDESPAPELPSLNTFPAAKVKSRLTFAERTLVARALCHLGGEVPVRLATVLMVENLRENRYDHASLLIMGYLLPRLPRFEDLSRLVNRIPGLRVGGPEYVATLAFFDRSLGRQGGKLDYLLHVLKEYRQHKWPDSPGELLALAALATELGEPQTAAGYLRQALKLKPGDQRFTALLLRCQLSQKDWGQALATLEKQPHQAGAALERAKLYLIRGQYEGVRAAVAAIPAGGGDYYQGQLLLAQALRLGGQYPEALQILEQTAGQISQDDYLMEKARILEGMGDRRAAGFYDDLSRRNPGSHTAQVAEARRAKALSDWGGAYRAYAQALQQAPQDIELLNELEYVRAQMRPEVASRGFTYTRGERRPEESLRPYQFSRFDREPRGAGGIFYSRPFWAGFDFHPRGVGLTSLPAALLWDLGLPVQPEAAGFSSSNKLYGGIFRFAGGFWIGKVLPVHLGAEYREYNQHDRRLLARFPGIGATVDFYDTVNSRLRRGEVTVGLGPLPLGDRLKISGELIGRRYWKRVDSSQMVQIFPVPLAQGVTHKEHHNRLLGSLELSASLGDRTDVQLSYSRRDIFDQEANLYPRLYQSIQDLQQAQITTLHQAALGYSHQIRPGLEWRGNFAGALFSDQNSRFTLFQGLTWQALKQPRMQLEFTPHLYLATYSQTEKAYFSPRDYLALGLGVDFHRQIFRLPTLILQGTAQAVEQNGAWGPALQGLAALELEWVQNFYTDLYCFYFREWVDNYHLLAVGASFRLRF